MPSYVIYESLFFFLIHFILKIDLKIEKMWAFFEQDNWNFGNGI